MPIAGFESICEKNAFQIVSKDPRNPQYHKGINKKRSYVTQYKIDGVVIKTGNKCDYLLINEETRTAYLIELKGSDLVEAARQLEATATALRQELTPYQEHLQYRIVANKCKTQEVDSSEYRKYKTKWKGRLKQQTRYIEESI